MKFQRDVLDRQVDVPFLRNRTNVMLTTLNNEQPESMATDWQWSRGTFSLGGGANLQNKQYDN